MAIPQLQISVQDGALPVQIPDPTQTTAKMGVATGAPALLSAVTAVGTTPPTVTVAGVPLGTYSVFIYITTGGALATAVFKYSLDGGNTIAVQNITTAASVVLAGTGITVTFGAGTYSTTNIYNFTAIPIPVYTFTSVADLQSTLMSGAVVEAAALQLSQPGGGGTVMVAPVYPSVVGTVQTGAHIGSGIVNPTVTGTPNDGYNLLVKCIVGGAVGTATFQYSLDNGNTLSATITTAATYAITSPVATGLTLNFGAGTYIAGDSWNFLCVAPSFGTADFSNSFNALAGNNTVWKWLHLVGQPTGADDVTKANAAATWAASLDTLMGTLPNNYRYARAFMEAPAVSDSSLITAFASTVLTRTGVFAGNISQQSVLSGTTGRLDARSSAFIALAAKSGRPISEDWAWTGAGALPASCQKILRDEYKTPGLDAQRFITLRTWPGKPGFFVTNPNMMVGTPSDFSLAQYGFVIDAACTAAAAVMQDFVSQKFRVNPNGTIFEIDARNAERKVLDAVAGVVVQPGHATNLTVTVNRTDNLLSTRKLRFDIRMTPGAYPKTVTVTIGFSNPSLAVPPTT